MNTPPRTLLPVAEFLALTGLPEIDVLRMLARGELRSQHAPSGCLLIDTATVSAETIAYRTTTSLVEEGDSRILDEAVASTLVQALDSMVDDALALALRWLAQDSLSQKDL
ncbi:MAG: hypothetical protein KDD69_03615 [Bdellovibrionales bacterium]|nr:hypothetical protein [Bdellovibrionales bacterium]